MRFCIITKTTLAIVLAFTAFGELNAQTDDVSVDRLVVNAHPSVKFGDVLSAKKLISGINSKNVSFGLMDQPGIQLTVITQFPDKYADRIAELKKTSDVKVGFDLPPLAQVDFSPEKLNEYRAKNGVIVFCYADWCPVCHRLRETELKGQPFLKFIDKAKVPFLWADMDDDESVKKFVEDLNISAIPTFVVYSPSQTKPIILTGLDSIRQLEKTFKPRVAEKQNEK